MVNDEMVNEENMFATKHNPLVSVNIQGVRPDYTSQIKWLGVHFGAG